MLTELCEYLRNWFCEDEDKHIGTITITGGAITARDGLLFGGEQSIVPATGQYYRIVGSIFSDGIHKYGDEHDVPADETFKGSVWLLRIPPVIIALANDIAAWRTKFGGIDSEAMSPFNSESFAGYSYSKSGAGASASASASGLTGWQAAFADRLNPWRKI